MWILPPAAWTLTGSSGHHAMAPTVGSNDDQPKGAQDPIPPLASYEDLKNDQWYINVNREIRRLRWSLDGPLDKAVQVMRHAYYDPDDPAPEPFYCPRTDDDEKGLERNWHAVSELSLFEPRVSSVTIDVHCLAEWADYWSEMHLECDCIAFEDDPSDVDYNEDGGHSNQRRSTYPCGATDPSSRYDVLTVDASSSVEEGSHGYVTIRDFVTAAHPWLMGLRELILRAPRGEEIYDFDMLYEDPEPSLPAETKLMALLDGGLHTIALDVMPEEEWLVESRTNPFTDHPALPRRYTPPPPAGLDARWRHRSLGGTLE
ncbi:hypothetical protein PG993_000191 [Apiospora rasikravindrae]|uniref:Uncharacterized protein n=1 Tax=Apiospora rasikravindrae TaxID=990691 RepID=A0ABR1UAL9_9PEZI